MPVRRRYRSFRQAPIKYVQIAENRALTFVIASYTPVILGIGATAFQAAASAFQAPCAPTVQLLHDKKTHRLL